MQGSLSIPSGFAVMILLALVVAGCSVDQRTLWVTRAALDASFPLDSGEGSGRSNFQDSPNIVYGTGGASGSGGAPPADSGPPTAHCVHGPDGGCTNTLATNAGFDTDTSGWNTSGIGILHWVKLDASGSSGSGALAVKNSNVGDVDGLEEVAAIQCIAATPMIKYDYTSAVYINKGQPFGSAGIAVWFYDQPDCKGDVDGGYTVSSMQLTGTWVPTSGTLQPLDGVKSQSIRLTATKAFRDGPFEVLFDDVRITASH
jgi:hypothetical protein